MILYPSALAMRQKPPPGSRLARPIAGGFWLPGMHGSVTDASGCNPPATVIGGVTRVQGPFGGPALKFDNASGYVDCGLNGNTASNWSTMMRIPRTFWAWVRRPTSSSVGAIYSKGNNTPNSGWSVSITTTGVLVGFIGTSNGHAASTNALSAGDWHHVAVTWDGGSQDSAGGRSTENFNFLGGNVEPVLGKFSIYVDAVWQGPPPSGNSAINQNGEDTFNMWVGQAAYVGGSGGAISTWADLEIDHWAIDHRVYGSDDVADLYRRPFRNFAPAPIFSRFIGGSAAAAARPRIFVCT